MNTKWVFKIKQDENGKNSLFKARLVARYFVQQSLRLRISKVSLYPFKYFVDEHD